MKRSNAILTEQSTQETAQESEENLELIRITEEGGYKRHRSKTLSRKILAREHRKMRARGEMLEAVEGAQPKTRSDCHNMPRPCLFVSCRHHLYLDINEESGSVKLNFPDKEVWELEESCALDVAERGGITLEEIGSIMNLTRERIRQLEIRGLNKLKMNASGEDSIEEYSNFDPEFDALLRDS